MAGQVIKKAITAADLKNPKRPQAKAKTRGKQTQIERSEAAIKGGGKTPAKLSKDYGKRKALRKRLLMLFLSLDDYFP